MNDLLKEPLITEDDAAIFFSESNLIQLRKTDKQIKEGKVVVKTMEELEAME